MSTSSFDVEILSTFPPPPKKKDPKKLSSLKVPSVDSDFFDIFLSKIELRAAEGEKECATGWTFLAACLFQEIFIL